MEEAIRGKFQEHAHYGFVIPDDREEFGGDFFVNKDNMKDAKTGDRVEARPMKYAKGKKPEAKILRVLTNLQPKVAKTEIVEGVYSGGDGNFGFIDIEGGEKGYFVYGKKKNGARDGDRVKAELVDFKGKKEAIVVEILESDEELLVGKYKDNDQFGFVLPDDKSGDIFIAGSRKGGASTGDRVEVQIIKRGGKNPEGVVRRIM
ncbi:hypothetical protein A9Q91_01965 [Candidatus Gracilibacteria bacterium 28_42_T64]|nr:hypothetical protein A9Q91_01965 [Candidatus Gracilibacteria bacterium 28_42_T64]